MNRTLTILFLTFVGLPGVLIAAILAWMHLPEATLRFTVAEPVGGSFTYAGAPDRMAVGTMVELPFGKLPVENNQTVCYLEVEANGLASRARMHVSNSGWKGGHIANGHDVDSLDGGAWAIWDHEHVTAKLPVAGSYMVMFSIQQGNLRVSGSSQTSERFGTLTLPAGSHELDSKHWTATIDAPENCVIKFTEWASSQDWRMQFTGEPIQIRNSTVQLDSADPISLPKLGKSPTFKARECKFIIRPAESLQCVTVRFKGDESPALMLRVSHGY